MKKWMTYGIALALTCALWVGQDAQAAGPVFVDENADGIDDNVRVSHHRGRKGVLSGRGTSSQLTEEQRAELKTLVDGLKESDTSKEDIRAAVKAKLEEWGIEFPERPAISPGLAKLLTDDQEAELTTLIDGLKESDTSREDIRAAVDAKLEEWGVERPERPERGLDALLTEDQEVAIQVLVEWLKAEGKTQEEIRTAVNEQLEAWGIERPERGLNALLTEAQETELKTLIEGLRASDTSREDIRAAVDAKLEEWGIERPERGLDAVLTEAQETELRTLIEGLRASDTSREDIRAAVDAKLEEWGVERPERSREGMRGQGGKRGRHGQRGGHRGRGPKTPSESTASG